MKILIISPEPWGDIKLSKHHYAKAFADMGHEVFFLSGKASSGKTEVLKNSFGQNIHEFKIKGSRLFNRLRFRFPVLYYYLLRKKSSEIVETIGNIELLISFERSGVFSNLEIFNAKRTIWFLADMPVEQVIKYYSGMDEIYSVSMDVLSKIKSSKPKKFIHHGCSIIEHSYKRSDNPKEIYYVGNLMMGEVLDRENLKKIINAFPNVNFNFVGPYSTAGNNIGGSLNKNIKVFIDFLKNQKNCQLLGVIKSEKLHFELIKADAFLLCYDSHEDINSGSNSHKIMNYLQYGKPIISTHISAYEDLNLFPMLMEKDNSKYLDLVQSVFQNWEEHDNLKMYDKRRGFARENSYERHAAEILGI